MRRRAVSTVFTVFDDREKMSVSESFESHGIVPGVIPKAPEKLVTVIFRSTAEEGFCAPLVTMGLTLTVRHLSMVHRAE